VIGGPTSVEIKGLPSNINDLFASSFLTPETNYNGAETVVAVSYTSNDPTKKSTTTFSLHISPINDSPELIHEPSGQVQEHVKTRLDVSIKDVDSSDSVCGGNGICPSP
jgi:hypothetical protein